MPFFPHSPLCLPEFSTLPNSQMPFFPLASLLARVLYSTQFSDAFFPTHLSACQSSLLYPILRCLFSPLTSLLARVRYSTQNECLSPCLLSPHCIFVLFLPPPPNIILFFIYSHLFILLTLALNTCVYQKFFSPPDVLNINT